MKAVSLASILLSTGVAAAQPAPDPAAAQPDPAAAQPGPAVAQPAPAPAAALPADAAPGEPPQLPGFVVIDGFDASSRAGLDLTYLEPNIDGFTGDKPTLLRFNAHARFVDKASGIGGYFQVPISYLSGDASDGSSETITDFGDIEGGVIYVPRLSTPGFGAVLHAGLTLPTGENDIEGLAGTLLGTIALPTFYNSLPKGITGKVGISPTMRSGNLFARFDLGLDWNFSSKDLELGKGIHYNFGVGVDLGKAALMFESENLSIVGDSDNGDVTFNSIAVSTRVDAGGVTPYFAVIVPLEEDTSEVIDFAVTAGIDFKL